MPEAHGGPAISCANEIAARSPHMKPIRWTSWGAERRSRPQAGLTSRPRPRRRAARSPRGWSRPAAAGPRAGWRPAPRTASRGRGRYPVCSTQMLIKGPGRSRSWLWTWPWTLTRPAGTFQSGMCVMSRVGSPGITSVIEASSLPVSDGLPVGPKSWLPRTSTFRPGMALSRASRSGSRARARATSPPQMIVSPGSTVVSHARSNALSISSTDSNGRRQ